MLALSSMVTCRQMGNRSWKGHACRLGLSLLCTSILLMGEFSNCRLSWQCMCMQAHGVMWALKGSLAKEPLMTETFLGSCLAILKPIQIALLIVAYFPRTVWPNLFALCSTINPRNGGSATHRLHV